MSLSDYPATAKDWLQGARPHTWANAFAPVIAGTGAAAAADGAHFGRALLALVVAWALIIGVFTASDAVGTFWFNRPASSLSAMGAPPECSERSHRTLR